MFTISKKDKAGDCKAKRCKEPAVSHGLCQRHFTEWHLAGQPDLGVDEIRVGSGTSEAEHRLTAELATARGAYDTIKNLPLTTPADVSEAQRWMEAIEARRDAHRGRRDEAIAPLADGIEQLRRWAAPAGKLYDQTIELLQERLTRAHIEPANDTRVTSSGHPPPSSRPRSGVHRGRLPARK